MSPRVRPFSKKQKAKETICQAKAGFRSGLNKGCVECQCSGNPPKCTLYPYDPNCCECKTPKQTPHHVIPAHAFMPQKQRALEENATLANPVRKKRVKGCSNYDLFDAPCICVTGSYKYSKTPSGSVAQHGKVHNSIDAAEATHGEEGTWNYGNAREAAVQSIVKNFPECTEKCIRKQLNDYHRDRCGITDDTPLRPEGDTEVSLTPTNSASGNGFPP